MRKILKMMRMSRLLEPKRQKQGTFPGENIFLVLFLHFRDFQFFLSFLLLFCFSACQLSSPEADSVGLLRTHQTYLCICVRYLFSKNDLLFSESFFDIYLHIYNVEKTRVESLIFTFLILCTKSMFPS